MPPSQRVSSSANVRITTWGPLVVEMVNSELLDMSLGIRVEYRFDEEPVSFCPP